MKSFERIAAKIVSRHCWNNGHTVKEIAAKANVSTSTMRRWLRETGLHTLKR